MFNKSLKRRLKILERSHKSEEPVYIDLGVVEKMTKAVRQKIREIEAAGNIAMFNTIVDPEPRDGPAEPEVQHDPPAREARPTEKPKVEPKDE